MDVNEHELIELLKDDVVNIELNQDEWSSFCGVLTVRYISDHPHDYTQIMMLRYVRGQTYRVISSSTNYEGMFITVDQMVDEFDLCKQTTSKETKS